MPDSAEDHLCLERVRPIILMLRPNSAHQALANDGINGAGDEEWLNMHIEQAWQHSRCRVGVERAKDKVARQCRLDGEVGRLVVADLPHHHHIGVLTENTAQTIGKGKANVTIDLDLVDSLHFVLHRVFQCDDVDGIILNFFNQCIEAGRFTATGRATGKNHPIGAVNPLANEPEGTPSIAHLLELEGCASLIQQANHHLLAPHHWANGNTEVNLLICHLDGKLPILRDTVLIDL